MGQDTDIADISSPLGILRLEFHDGMLVSCRLHGDGIAPPPYPPRSCAAETAKRELDEYFAGDRRRFTVRLDATGTAFKLAVWKALRDIPFGEVRSYGEVARAIGMPGAARAVGRACGANPLLIFTPCHRVVAATGLGGFGAGLENKRWLLAMEAEASHQRNKY